MHRSEEFDVAIIGGGPAGACAALRLLALGYRVALIEQATFPRPQIGESLSPGVWNIFNYLQADELIGSKYYLHDLPAAIIWETQTISFTNAGQRGTGVMVDRGMLDKSMLDLAVLRGLKLYQPAKFEGCKKTKAGWELFLKQENCMKNIHAVFILDARGRKGSRLADKILIAPASLSLHVNLPASSMPYSTMIEATKSGWIWGSPLPGNRFRAMAFIRPEDVRNKPLDKTFNEVMSESVLFMPVKKLVCNSAIQTCPVHNYCHHTPWEDNFIRLGETAFTLDPLSSSGVEKAMRLSLQAVIAIHTTLQGGDPQMAQHFYEDKIIESVTVHQNWTSNHYASAWPGSEYPYWHERSKILLSAKDEETSFYKKLHTKAAAYRQTEPSPTVYANNTLTHIWHEKVQVSKNVVFSKSVCVVGDHLEIKTAVKSPLATKEAAYFEQVEIVPLLALISSFDTLGEIVFKWSRVVSFEQAKRLALGLWSSRIIVAADKISNTESNTY